MRIMSRVFDAVVIGSSAGGLLALTEIIPKLPKEFISVIVVMHLKPDSESFMVPYLAQMSALSVKEAVCNEPILKNIVYIAPPYYHLLIEHDQSFSYSLEEPVNFCRPSIDLLFESAALAYQDRLLGLVLTGANSDGSLGLKSIKEHGGLLMVQDPKTAEFPEMPSAAIELNEVDYIIPLNEIADKLMELTA